MRCLLSHLPLDPQTIPVSTDVLRTITKPLTPVIVSPDECDTVTPSSLLHHHSVKPTSPIGTLPTRESLLQNHRHVQEHVDVYWQKWMQLYLQYLQKHHTQRILQMNFEIGDLVHLADHPTARDQDPLTCVVETFPNQEGVIRCIRVMTANRNQLNSNLPCTRTTQDRDSTKLALVEFPATNPISEQHHLNCIDNDDQECTELRGSALSDIV